MKLRRYKNATVAKYHNKRAIVYTEDDGFSVAFRKLKEVGDEKSIHSIVDFDKKTMTFGFKLTREGAIALCSTLFVEIYKDIDLEQNPFEELFKDL